VTRVGGLLDHVRPWPNPAGFCAAAEDQPRTLALLGHAVPYRPAWRLERSLAPVATSWFHEGHLGIQRVGELAVQYAAFLASCAVLSDAQLWKDARREGFLGRAPG